MTIRNARPGDLPAFSRLWETAFHEGEETSRFVFEQFAQPENVYLAEENGQLLAILSAIPGHVEHAAGSYFFGLATQPSAQGRGIMTRMMDEVCEMLRARGQKFVCLVPASQSLFQYYAQRGFETAFYRLSGPYSGAPKDLPAFEAAPFTEGQKLSPVQFCYDPFSARAMIHSLGAVQIRTQAGYGVFMPAEGKWHCVELTDPAALDCALSHLHVPEIQLRCPALPALEGIGQTVPQGMIRVLDPKFTWKTLYLSLDGSI